MLDTQGVLLVLGLIILGAILLMILVRPNAGKRYRRVGLGQTGAPGSLQQQPERPPGERPALEEKPEEKRRVEGA
jgi:hypothetical protein